MIKLNWREVYYKAIQYPLKYYPSKMSNIVATSAAFPSEFMCPISMDLMTDPVIGNDGHTYEKTAITEWLINHSVSPLTRRPMTLQDIQPNFALRGAIERWRLSNEPMPAPVELTTLVDTKTISVTSNKMINPDGLSKTVLDIKTTHATPMESVLIAVLDVSGSMDTSANNNRQAEGDQFSRLDLVKHSMKTLATLLNAEFTTTQSSLGIVSFSSAANLVMPITKMNATGLNVATTAISALKTGGATNIWDGLRIGLLQAQTAIERNPNANIQILLLTDGEPSQDLLPPLGIKSTLKRKMDSLKGRVTISTFGFGYALDADLLESICILGNGSYGFIPDCSMVGTVFINWAAKALLTLVHHITIKLPNGNIHNVGDIIVGRSQTLVIPYTELTEVEVTYDNGQTDTVPVTTTDETHNDAIYLDKLLHEMEDIKKWKHYGAVVTQHILALKAEINSASTPSEFMMDIARDIESDDDGEGQILKACSSNNWWNTWGRNHCLAYFHALKLQQCINFKDKALQHFASDAFKDLQEKGIDIFSNIPAPTPSVRTFGQYLSSGSNGSYGYAPNPYVPVSAFATTGTTDPNLRSININMGSYVSNSGPCFTGDCMIKMEDGSEKRVDELKKGDMVYGGDIVKGSHKVVAVLVTPVNKEVDMVVFTKGLKITPWHPMILKDDDEWVFPADVRVPTKMYVNNYYNLVLETGHTVELNTHQVVTLGHGFTSNEVIKHEYFGSQMVIRDLMKHPEWDSGILHMDPLRMTRSSETGLVIKI
jgi:Mg-chelatase subunit ChlD